MYQLLERKIRMSNGTNIVRDRGTKGGAIGAGTVKSGPVCSILNGVGKGEELFISVVGRSKHHADHCAGEASSLGT